MNVFSRLSQRAKLLIVASSLLLVTLSLGVLVFGSNAISHENALLDQAKSGTRVDMLYVTPTESRH